MENREIVDKGEALKRYLKDMEWYQFQIKELFIAQEITQQEYTEMMTQSTQSYAKFLEDLCKKKNKSLASTNGDEGNKH